MSEQARANRRQVVLRSFLWAVIHEPLRCITIARNAGIAYDTVYRKLNWERRLRGQKGEWS